MKISHLLILACAVIFINGCSGNNYNPEEEKKILTEIQAKVENAKSFAEKLIADSVFADAIDEGSFVYVSSGKQFNKETGSQFLKYLFANRKSEKIEILKHSISLHNNSTALYNSYCKATITDLNDKTDDIYFSITWVWAQTKNGWKAVHVHESPVPKPNKLEKAAIQLVVSSFSVELSSKSPSPENIESMLKAFLDRHPNIFGSAFAFPDSAQVGQTQKTAFYLHRKASGFKFVKISESFDYTKSDWFTEPIKIKSGYWTAPYYDKGGADLWMLTYSYPVYNKKGEFLGVITGDVLI